MPDHPALPRVDLRDLAITTCGAPQLLLRSLRGWDRHLAAYGRRCTILVADDSRAPADVAAARAAADTLAASGREVVFVGIAERRRWVDVLSRRVGVPRELLAYALLDPTRSGYTLGANLNAVLLATAGRPVLSVDQDIEPVAFRPSPTPGRPRVTDDSPISYRWYDDEEETLAWSAPCDVLGEHATWLGRRVDADRELDVERASSSLLARIDRGAHVIGTWFGVLGHPGFSDVRTVALEHAGPDRASDPRGLAALLECPRALRCPERCTLGRGRDWTSAITAYDGRVLQPAFFPVGRGIDLLFGWIAGVCRSDALFAHLPWALAHDRPTEPAPFGPPRLNLTAALAELSMRAATRLSEGTAADRMAALGRRLVELAALPPGAFAMLLRSVDVAIRRARAAELSRRIEARADACRAWTSRMHAQVAALLAEPLAVVAPRELCTQGVSPAAALRRFAELVEHYGRLLEVWPAIVEAARDLGPEALAAA